MRVLLLVVPVLLSGCALLTSRPSPSLPPGVDLEDVLVCEGVERDACEEAAMTAFGQLLIWEDDFPGLDSMLRTLESVTIRADGSWDICWAGGCGSGELGTGLRGSPPA